MREGTRAFLEKRKTAVHGRVGGSQGWWAGAVVQELTGSLTAAGYRFAIVVSRFNEDITEGLLNGAHGLSLWRRRSGDEDLTVVRVPGAFEIPVAALSAGRERDLFDAIICLGCLIKGDTMHFEYIAEAASHGHRASVPRRPAYRWPSAC